MSCRWLYYVRLDWERERDNAINPLPFLKQTLISTSAATSYRWSSWTLTTSNTMCVFEMVAVLRLGNCSGFGVFEVFGASGGQCCGTGQEVGHTTWQALLKWSLRPKPLQSGRTSEGHGYSHKHTHTLNVSLERCKYISKVRSQQSLAEWNCQQHRHTHTGIL